VFKGFYQKKVFFGFKDDKSLFYNDKKSNYFFEVIAIY